ncbi:glycosyl transferase [Terrihabitans soli]|uniref:Glycosyl transferase n=1 Tax=Terrihabitans soli TaxID=708113 RepID=A0A6S6QIT6_9HYPH|nr:glycosyl transferase [Terrihabitans soli]BCJ91163.1 glycosyl transferase [Terrihabitans soli]
MKAPWASDRPLRRRAIKIAALALGPRWSHTHNWTPFLELRKADGREPGTIVYRGRKVGRFIPADRLKDKAGAAAIQIIGSGPSVLMMDLSAIAPGSAILLNGALELIGSQIERPLAVIIEDERFIWRHFAKFRAKVPPGVPCILSVGVIRAICEIDAAWFTEREIVLIDDIRKPYHAPKPKLGDLKTRSHVAMSHDGDAGISLAPDLGVFQGGSVVISALQFAIHCRPKSIGLIGIDISNANEPRFYEGNGSRAPSGLKRAEGRILSHLLLGRTICASNEIELLNHSPTSVLNRHDFAYDNRFEKRKT